MTGDSYDSVRHESGEAAGEGPTGWIMLAYISGDRDVAARNGEDAVVEYLLPSRCDYLVHNGSSLARTVLLNAPELPYVNTHTRRPERVAPPAQGIVATDRREVAMMALDREMIERVKADKKRHRSSSFRYQDRPNLLSSSSHSTESPT